MVANAGDRVSVASVGPIDSVATVTGPLTKSIQCNYHHKDTKDTKEKKEKNLCVFVVKTSFFYSPPGGPERLYLAA
jgi:hypothetical protein